MKGSTAIERTTSGRVHDHVEERVSEPRFGTVRTACKIIGGEERPIHRATYYRGVKAGIFPAPEHPSPGIARVDLDKLAAMLTGR
ncbi:MAG: hypothetical protein KGR48_03305 [Alphaproteobacteria bacterium]|nr:hypothetical protein [Alphaproteobacteria bacterium]